MFHILAIQCCGILCECEIVICKHINKVSLYSQNLKKCEHRKSNGQIAPSTRKLAPVASPLSFSFV